jgi:hypothetical protein
VLCNHSDLKRFNADKAAASPRLHLLRVDPVSS